MRGRSTSFDALRRLIAEQRPDVAHFHNTFPQISPAAYVACREAGVPVVQTLHNYRMFCANGLLNRAGEPCERCVGRNATARARACAVIAVRASPPPAWSLGSTLHRARRHLPDAWSIASSCSPISRARRFIAHGLPAERISVRGNCLAHDPGAGEGGGGYALYVGRLTAEKGVGTLIRAWRSVPAFPLRIAGDGELRAALEREAAGPAHRIPGPRSAGSA